MYGYSPDLHEYIIEVGLRHVKILVTLASFQGHSLVYRNLLTKLMDFCQTCIDISYGQSKELFRFW